MNKILTGDLSVNIRGIIVVYEMPIVAFDGKKCQYCGFSNERCECVCDDWTNYTTPSNICSQAIGSSILGLKFYVLS